MAAQDQQKITRVVLVSYEFLYETVFSGNGVLSRSMAASILLNSEQFAKHEIFVVCASPKQKTITIVDESLAVANANIELKLRALVIPVTKWLRLDWESDYQLFSEKMKQFISESDWDNNTMKYQKEFFNFYQSAKHMIFIDYTGYFVAKNILSVLSPQLWKNKVINGKTKNPQNDHNNNNNNNEIGQKHKRRLSFEQRRRNSIELDINDMNSMNNATSSNNDENDKKIDAPKNEKKEKNEKNEIITNVAVSSNGGMTEMTTNDDFDRKSDDTTSSDDMKSNDKIECLNENIKVTFLNFRVFHNNANVKDDSHLQERLFYEKWEFESTNIADSVIALNGDECKILANLFGQNRINLINFDSKMVDALTIKDTKNKFYQINGTNKSDDSAAPIGYKFATVHPPLRGTIERISVTYWKQEIFTFETSNNNNKNSKNNKNNKEKEEKEDDLSMTADPHLDKNKVLKYSNENEDYMKYFNNLINNRKYMLCFSRISREKNIDIFIDLMEILGDKWFKENNIIPYIIGSANDLKYYQHLKSRIENAKIECKFDDFMPIEKLAQVLMDTKLAIHPAIKEPFGMTICEAAAFGVPSMVNSDGIGAVEVLTDNGVFLSSMTDGKKLANDVKTYLKKENNKLFVDTSRNAMVKSLNYGLDACGDALKSLLKDI